MLTVLIYLLVMVLVGGLLFLGASAVFGRSEELPPLPPGTTATVLPAEDVTAADVKALRFQQTCAATRRARSTGRWTPGAGIDSLRAQLAARDAGAGAAGQAGTGGATMTLDERSRCPWAVDSAAPGLTPTTTTSSGGSRCTAATSCSSACAWRRFSRDCRGSRSCASAKRSEGLRRVDPERVAVYREADVERLLGDAGIVRNRAKIEAVIGNARAVLDLSGTDLDTLLWSFAPPRRARRWTESRTFRPSPPSPRRWRRS